MLSELVAEKERDAEARTHSNAFSRPDFAPIVDATGKAGEPDTRPAREPAGCWFVASRQMNGENASVPITTP